MGYHDCFFNIIIEFNGKITRERERDRKKQREKENENSTSTCYDSY